MRRFRARLVFVGLALVVLPAVAQDRPRILVTNDDGYRSVGLTTLVAALSEVGEVTVAAPSSNRSGSSQSLGSLRDPFRVERVQIEGATVAVAVDGTPAAAVTFGVLELAGDRPFDLVVSGINNGANVGEVSHLSGTVGAAMQAAFLGQRAIAVSQFADEGGFEVAAAYTAKLAVWLLGSDVPRDVILSVNVPEAAVKAGGGEALVRPMGGSFLSFDGFASDDPGASPSTWTTRLGRDVSAPAGSDTEAYLAGRITVTPLRFDWTDEDLVRELGTALPQP